MQSETTVIRSTPATSRLVHRATDTASARPGLPPSREKRLDGVTQPAQRSGIATAATLLRETVEAVEAEPVSTLPEKWDTDSLEDELKVHTSHLRNRTLRRKTPRRLVRRQEARGSNVVDSLQWGLKRGAFLNKKQQAFLAEKYQKWQNAKQTFNELTSETGRQPSPAEWAQACQVSESELRTALSDGPRAADLLLASVQGLLKTICMRYMHLNCPFDDLFLEAQTLWLEAVRSYDPTKGAQLNSFAVMFLQQRLVLRMNEISDRMSRAPEQVRDEARMVRAKDDFQSKHGREPSLEELSKLIGKSVTRVKFLRKGIRSIVSFDQEVSKRDVRRDSETLTLGESVEEESHIGEDQDASLLPNIRKDLASEFEQSMEALIQDPRDREMLRWHYQLDDPNGPPPTFKEMGEHFGLSYETVRLRVKKSVALLGKHAKIAKQLKDYHVAEILDY